MAPDEQEGPSQPTDPIEAYAKLVGLPTGTCPGLRFYATSLPLTIGSGAMHVQSWAHGDHCMVGQDAAVATAHLELIFEPLSLSHEVRVLGEAGVRIDGVHYGRKALVRVVSGSTVRIGAYEIAILFPHPARGTPLLTPTRIQLALGRPATARATHAPLERPSRARQWAAIDTRVAPA